MAAVLLLALAALPGSSYAASITLAWEPNTEPDLAGYRLHYGTASRTYTAHVDVDRSLSTATVDVPDGTTRFFAVTAFDGNRNESGYSNEVVYPETISQPQPPAGPTSVQTWQAHTYTAAGAVTNSGDAVQYRFSWSDGTDSGWLPAGVTSASKSWGTAATYPDVRVEARCAAHTTLVSALSDPIAVVVSEAPGEVVTPPTAPAGPADARTGLVYGFSTGGAHASTGDPLQYRFQWGDGTVSPWTDPAADGNFKAWKSWAATGTYDVVAEARCALHPGVAGVSAAFTVSVAGGTALRLADTFSDGTAAGDPQWRVLSGSWLVGVDKVFTGAGIDAANLAVVRALPRFKTGRIAARVALTPQGLAQGAGVVFALRDAHHYRYVTVGGSGIAIGQAGDTPKVKAGRKAFLPRALAAGQWQRLRIDLLPNGTVKVFLGTSRKPALAYRFADAVAGGVGLLAARSVAYFDDYRVWDARILR